MRLLISLLVITLATFASSQTSYLNELRWRMIGPFRGGRTVAAQGVPSQPGTFYIGVNNGGVWKTDDYGRTWNPIFDDQPTGSIGALAVAPSDPNVIYVGTGEGIQRPDLSTGDGVYKSVDAGKSWTHLGLRDGQQISAIIVDPHDSARVFVAVLGHPYGPNEERGVFRSSDGGTTWQKVLYKDADTGAIALAFDPTNSQTIYADLFASRQAPWENGDWFGPNSGLYKSTDGGTTWTRLQNGMPAGPVGRIGFGISASQPSRLFALIDAKDGGVFRSDDAGQSWRKVNDQPRIWGRGADFAEIKVDPKDPDRVYIANTSTYRSEDGGQTWTAIKGAPGGDDYHTIWIDPNDPKIILLACDQGATISVNQGRTWSSWYNQPTAQMYHVATDNRWPYRVYGGQQESGSVGISSRGNDGAITFRDWHPVGTEEYAYVAPDPLHPNLVYGGKVTKFDWVTGEVQDVGPDAMQTGKYRFLRTAPLEFSPADPTALYLAGNVVFKTIDGAHSWQVVSPDLTRPDPDGQGVFKKPGRRGVVYALGLSPKSPDVIWAGTDDGLVQRTGDGGKTWQDVTPPALTAWSKVAQIDAGHWDVNTAYVAVNRMRLDDMRPHAFRTHDGGKTWTEIDTGLPADASVDVVREDPLKPGLLYAGTERAVYFSFDDGDHWQPLRLNMPATSIRDLVVHEADLVVATHGRSFWILDDISALRQWDKASPAKEVYLFAPETAVRVHPNNNTDTPLPPEEPVGQNPPEGAILDYVLKVPVKNLTLEIIDSSGRMVRRYTNHDPAPVIHPDEMEFPTYWERDFHPLSDKAGFHRFDWSLCFPPLGSGFFTMGAIAHDTPTTPEGPWVLPGTYTVRLITDDARSEQTLTVVADPRLKLAKGALERQYQVVIDAYDAEIEALTCLSEIKAALAQPSLSDANRTELAAIAGNPSPGRRRRRAPGDSLSALAAQLDGVWSTISSTDFEPTQGQVLAERQLRREVDAAVARWYRIKTAAPR
jgi:photosystem II stability/assembly factor-like uncharacterized protein